MKIIKFIMKCGFIGFILINSAHANIRPIVDVEIDTSLENALYSNKFIVCNCIARSAKNPQGMVYQMNVSGSSFEKIRDRCLPNESQLSNNVTEITINRCEGL